MPRSLKISGVVIVAALLAVGRETGAVPASTTVTPNGKPVEVGGG